MASIVNNNIHIDRRKLAEFCQRNDIRRLSLFGSVLRPDFHEDSDVDVLIEWEPGAKVGIFKKAGIEMELSELLGREVDLRTPAEISTYIRDRVLEEAVEQYVHR